jgi:hypothetical protein
MKMKLLSIVTVTAAMFMRCTVAVFTSLLVALRLRVKARNSAQSHSQEVKSDSFGPAAGEAFTEPPGVLYSPTFLRDLFVSNTFPPDTAMPHGSKFSALPEAVYSPTEAQPAEYATNRIQISAWSTT